MFGFGSVTARKAELEVGAMIRRLLDKTTSRIPPGVEEGRLTRWCKRMLPVFVLPWADRGHRIFAPQCTRPQRK
jgi:hypothetical protein